MAWLHWILFVQRNVSVFGGFCLTHLDNQEAFKSKKFPVWYICTCNLKLYLHFEGACHSCSCIFASMNVSCIIASVCVSVCVCLVLGFVQARSMHVWCICLRNITDPSVSYLGHLLLIIHHDTRSSNQICKCKICPRNFLLIISSFKK